MSRENPVMKKLSKDFKLLFVFSALLFFSLSINANADSKKLEIAFLGDSLTAGYGLNPGEAFPELTEKSLNEKGSAFTIINAGVSGDTTSGGLARLNWSIPDTVDGVVLALGANDALRGIPVEQAQKNLNEMISQLKARGVAVLLVGMLSPPNMGEQYETAFNAIFPGLAEKHDLLFYPFLLDGVAAEPSLNQRDGIHPNAEGSKIIAANFQPVFEQFLGSIK